MTPLTILHLAANRWWTGSAEPVIRLVSGLSARGHHVRLGLYLGSLAFGEPTPFTGGGKTVKRVG